MLGRSGFLLLAAAALLVRPARQSSYLSHTTDAASELLNAEVCPNAPNERKWQGEFNLTQYKREIHTEVHKHRRALDEEEEFSWRLRGLYEYPLLLPTPSIQTALSNLGDTRRLERFLAKLLAGESVTVVALGGSVTVGHGPESKQDAWVYRVFSWLNATFPHPDHKFINKAIPAVTSSYIAPCVLSMVSPDTDLILLEFTFNDGERTSTSDMRQPTRLGLERLMRKLMRMESRPAIVNLHYTPFNLQEHFYDGVEDQMDVIFKYYAVSSLSMRSALHRFLAEQSWLIDKMWFMRDAHPTCIGSKFTADIVIGFLQDAAAFVLRTHRGPPHELHKEVLWEHLPAPMLAGNAAEELEECILEDSFQALGDQIEGWQWLDEGRNPEQHKWGFISWTPGESMRVKVPLGRFMQQLGEDRRLLVALGVLMSYEHMGWLQVECVDGCSCQQRQINAIHLMKYSMTYWKGFEVTIDDGAASCALRVTNFDRSSSFGEHKVKVTSLMVSPALDSFVESWNYE